jgi:hypothetical protein
MFKKDVDYLSNIESPLKQNWRAFLKAQPLVCDNCGNFTDTPREYCERCGFRHSLRKAKKKDFYKYKLKTTSDEKSIDFEQRAKNKAIENSPKSQIHKVLSQKEKISFLKKNPYFCAKCHNFIDHPEPTGPQKPEKFYYETFCEICGSSDSIRVAKIEDFKLYTERQQSSILDQIKEQKQYKTLITENKKLEIKEQVISVPLKPKIEEKTDLKSSPQINEISPKSNNWKSKLTEIPNTMNDPIDTERERLNTQFTEQKEEPKKLKASPVSISKEHKPIKKPMAEGSQIKDETIKKASTVSVKKEEKTKKISHYCKFCGMELAMMAKFCHQCGTIIKYK